MERHPWPDRLAAELARRGVPAGWRRRLLAELADHIDDLMEEGGAMTDATLEAKLGAPDQLAAHAADQYRRAGWAARRPWLAFGLLPVPVAVLGWVAVYLALGVSGAAVIAVAGGDPDGLSREATVNAVYALHYAMRFLPFVLAALWVGRLAARHRVGWKWAAAGVGQLSLFAGTFVSQVVLSDVPGQSYWMLGFSLPPYDPTAAGPWGVFFLPPHWGQLAQMTAVVAAAVWVMRWVRRRETVRLAVG